MTNRGNWPDPERPGVPMFPERDGEHVLSYNGVLSIVKWRSNAPFSRWVSARGFAHLPEHIGGNPEIVYITPCIIPAQIAELLDGERERAVSACLSQKEVFESPEYAGGPLGAVMERFACDRCVEEILNLGTAP